MYLLILKPVFLSDEFSVDLVTYGYLCNHFFATKENKQSITETGMQLK